MSTGLKAVLWIAGLLIIGYFGLSFLGAVAVASQQIEDEKNYPKEVTYKVTCAACGLTYSNATEDTEQIDVTGEWTMTFMADKRQHLYLSAQEKRGNTVDVQILVEGEAFKEGHSVGQYHIASASGSLP